MRHLIFIAIVLLLTCCTWKPRGRLAEAERLSDSVPGLALDTLAAIDRATLGEADRYFYDLLRIKAADKAYIEHTSDTLIVGVLNYAYTHQSHGYYPEALYYAGRVYSDLGDYPSALRYYQDALALLPAEKQKLRGNILSQTGSLLDNLRLYNEAIPYLEEVLDIDQKLNDTINLVYDLQLLGGIYLRADSLDSAEHYFRKALENSKNLEPEHSAKSKLFLAATKYEKGDVDSAMIYLRGTKENIDSLSYNYLLAYSSDIYLKAGMIDTAYLYADELIHRKEPTNKVSGYHLILDESLRGLIPTDSLYTYITHYINSLERQYNGHQSELAVYQRALFNYNVHEEKRKLAEQSRDKMLEWLKTLLVLILFLTIIILVLNIRNKKNLLNLHLALDNVEKLKCIINNTTATNESNNIQADSENEEKLKRRIQQELDSVFNGVNSKPKVSLNIIKSDIYQELQSYIQQEKCIINDESFWVKLENVVLESSPDFKTNLQILTNGKLTQNDYRTSLLIKCGIQPTQMTILFSRSKSAITSRRKKLCSSILGDFTDTKVIDDLILLL